jgi:hypothetical protein
LALRSSGLCLRAWADCTCSPYPVSSLLTQLRSMIVQQDSPDSSLARSARPALILNPPTMHNLKYLRLPLPAPHQHKCAGRDPRGLAARETHSSAPPARQRGTRARERPAQSAHERRRDVPAPPRRCVCFVLRLRRWRTGPSAWSGNLSGVLRVPDRYWVMAASPAMRPRVGHRGLG